MPPIKLCQHNEILLLPSPHAATAGYRRPTSKQRRKAAELPITALENDEQTFPGPLVLPGDDLALDPKYPAQSVRSWLKDKDRNEVTDERRTIYVVPPPDISSGVDFVESWTTPVFLGKKGGKRRGHDVNMNHIVDYVAAFYHGLPVKLLPKSTLKFEAWSEDEMDLARLKTGRVKKTMLLGLNTGKELLGVHCRPAPDKVFGRQMNLNDLIDGAISILPEDAFALVMLMDHDLYEDEEDEFVCGRAYGGSRVAVISSSRYDPELDAALELDRGHAWPNSHCVKFVRDILLDSDGDLVDGAGTLNRLRIPDDKDDSSGMCMAVSPPVRFQEEEPQPQAEYYTGLWLGRMCRTVTHELGHCFGIDHCTYYACVMQGSASLLEDMRQPPYLCPIDLIKVLRATGATEEQHYTAMINFCRVHRKVEMFAAYAVWMHQRTRRIYDQHLNPI